MKLHTSVFATVVAAAAFFVPVLALAAGPAPVNLLSAGNFVILSQTGITDVPSSVIIGNVGAYPISGTAILLTCPEVTGTIYSRNAAGPLPCRVTNASLLLTAVNNMVTAYNAAAGMTGPTATELGAGNIGGMTLAPGLYKWSTGVTIPTNLTLSGGANDVWIFQIAGNLNIASGGSVPAGIKVILTGGAKASNVFWQVGGPVGATLGTYSTFNGTILSAKQVILQTGAVLNGRALAQTQVTLDANTVTSPGNTTGTGGPPPATIPGSISGMTFNDVNSNGKKDTGEVGLQGWTINLTKVGSSAIVASAVTNLNGNYSFTNLTPGTYQAREVPQAGWIETSVNPSNIKIVSGTVSTNDNFGNHLVPPPLPKGNGHGGNIGNNNGSGSGNNNNYGNKKGNTGW